MTKHEYDRLIADNERLIELYERKVREIEDFLGRRGI